MISLLFCVEGGFGVVPKILDAYNETMIGEYADESWRSICRKVTR